MNLSPQQSAYIDWVKNGRGSCILTAVAGAGKTFTLIHGIEFMLGSIFLGVFNKKIEEEIKSRAPRRSNLDIGTMHAAGFKFFRRAYPAVKVDGNKCKGIFRTLTQDRKFEGTVLKLVSLAKQAGIAITQDFSPDKPWLEIADHFDIELFDEETATDNTAQILTLAKAVLEMSLMIDSQIIDFDDMIHAPLYHRVRVFEYDWILIDEAQDTNATRRLLALRLLKPNGRLVAVGDPHQAIYGFTGADADSLSIIAEKTRAIELPLTVTYRCPKAVVEYARQFVSHITAHESSPEGKVSTGKLKELQTLAKPGDAILCRFNAPLIQNVYAFIREGIPATVEGRDIGNGLKALAKKWKVTSMSTLYTRLDSYLERETRKFREKEQEAKAVALEDKVNCLRVIMDRVKSPAEIEGEIDRIFVDDGNGSVVLFSSIHKSKGREWNKVVWLQSGPAKGRKAWEQEQEINLCYVAATRAKEELVLVNLQEKK